MPANSWDFWPPMRAAFSAATALALLSLAAFLAGCGGGGDSPAPKFTVGGTLSGLVGSVVLQNNGAGNLTVSASGAFTFSGSLSSGAAYNAE